MLGMYIKRNNDLCQKKKFFFMVFFVSYCKTLWNLLWGNFFQDLFNRR